MSAGPEAAGKRCAQPASSKAATRLRGHSSGAAGVDIEAVQCHVETEGYGTTPSAELRRRIIADAATNLPSWTISRLLTILPVVMTVAEPIGLQLYTLREEIAKDLPRTLQHVAKIGYREVELFQAPGPGAKELAGIIRDAGLVAPSAHYYASPSDRLTAEQVTDGWRRHVAQARELRLEYMVYCWGPDDARSLDDYKQLA